MTQHIFLIHSHSLQNNPERFQSFIDEVESILEDEVIVNEVVVGLSKHSSIKVKHVDAQFAVYEAEEFADYILNVTAYQEEDEYLTDETHVFYYEECCGNKWESLEPVRYNVNKDQYEYSYEENPYYGEAIENQGAYSHEPKQHTRKTTLSIDNLQNPEAIDEFAELGEAPKEF